MQETTEPLPLEEAEIDAHAPVGERVRSLSEQLGGDPHEFTCRGIRVRVSFAGQVSLEEAVARYLGAREP